MILQLHVHIRKGLHPVTIEPGAGMCLARLPYSNTIYIAGFRVKLKSKSKYFYFTMALSIRNNNDKNDHPLSKLSLLPLGL